MKQPKVALQADTPLTLALHTPDSSAESPSRCRELTWDLFAGTSMEAAGGDAVAEVPEAELNRGRRKGKRPTRAEKGSYMGNQDFVREVKDGLQHSMSPPQSLGFVLALQYSPSFGSVNRCVQGHRNECTRHQLHSCLIRSIECQHPTEVCWLVRLLHGGRLHHPCCSWRACPSQRLIHNVQTTFRH